MGNPRIHIVVDGAVGCSAERPLSGHNTQAFVRLTLSSLQNDLIIALEAPLTAL